MVVLVKSRDSEKKEGQGNQHKEGTKTCPEKRPKDSAPPPLISQNRLERQERIQGH